MLTSGMFYIAKEQHLHINQVQLGTSKILPASRFCTGRGWQASQPLSCFKLMPSRVIQCQLAKVTKRRRKRVKKKDCQKAKRKKRNVAASESLLCPDSALKLLQLLGFSGTPKTWILSFYSKLSHLGRNSHKSSRRVFNLKKKRFGSHPKILNYCICLFRGYGVGEHLVRLQKYKNNPIKLSNDHIKP